MMKRLFWFGLGMAAGIVLVSKTRAYARSQMPDVMSNFLMGPDMDTAQASIQTARGLINDFQRLQASREQELEQRFTHRQVE